MKCKVQITKEMEIKSKLHEYCKDYGFTEYIELLISTHALIRGDWSYNNARGDLAHAIAEAKGIIKLKAGD